MTKPVTPQDMFELWQRMVNPGAYPLQSLMFPALDPKELEKKIAELQVVEHWLKANVSMVQMTVKSLEFQLSMVKGGQRAAESIEAAGKEAPPNPAAWMWNLMAQAATPAKSAVADDPAPPEKPSPPKRSQRRRGS